MRRDPVWAVKAACRGTPTAIFFPQPDEFDTMALAQSICAGCPVKTECLEYALTTFHQSKDDQGIWGGTSQRTRARMRRDRKECQ